MRWTWTTLAGAVLLVALASAAANADSIGDVEGARAKERAGYGLSQQDVDHLDRHGGNADGYGWGYAYEHDPYDSGYEDEPDYDEPLEYEDGPPRRYRY